MVKDLGFRVVLRCRSVTGIRLRCLLYLAL